LKYIESDCFILIEIDEEERNRMLSEKVTAGFFTGTETEPFRRSRRLRMTDAFRSMVRETELSIKDFIYPLFVVPGTKVRREVTSMPGVYQLSIDEVVRECVEVRTLGIPAVILFGIPSHKDEVGSEAYEEAGIVQLAIRAIKKDVPEMVVTTDVCLCEYTSHGHCGIVRGNEIVNDESKGLTSLWSSRRSHISISSDA
jgi:porphobilinogen synthase